MLAARTIGRIPLDTLPGFGSFIESIKVRIELVNKSVEASETRNVH